MTLRPNTQGLVQNVRLQAEAEARRSSLRLTHLTSLHWHQTEMNSTLWPQRPYVFLIYDLIPLEGTLLPMHSSHWRSSVNIRSSSRCFTVSLIHSTEWLWRLIKFYYLLTYLLNEQLTHDCLNPRHIVCQKVLCLLFVFQFIVLSFIYSSLFPTLKYLLYYWAWQGFSLSSGISWLKILLAAYLGACNHLHHAITQPLVCESLMVLWKLFYSCLALPSFYDYHWPAGCKNRLQQSEKFS